VYEHLVFAANIVYNFMVARAFRLCVTLTNVLLISLVPKPRPAFHWLQYSWKSSESTGAWEQCWSCLVGFQPAGLSFIGHKDGMTFGIKESGSKTNLTPNHYWLVLLSMPYHTSQQPHPPSLPLSCASSSRQEGEPHPLCSGSAPSCPG